MNFVILSKILEKCKDSWTKMFQQYIPLYISGFIALPVGGKNEMFKSFLQLAYSMQRPIKNNTHAPGIFLKILEKYGIFAEMERWEPGQELNVQRYREIVWNVHSVYH